MTGHGNRGGTQDGRTPVLAGPGGPDASSGADGAPVSPMTRDELIGLMTAWGWTLSDDMPGYQVWASPRTWRGRHVDEVIVPGEDWRPNVKRYMARAVGAFAAAEAGRLLDVVRRVEALAESWTYKGEHGWDDGSHAYGPGPEGEALDHAAREIRRVLGATTETSEGETDAG